MKAVCKTQTRILFAGAILVAFMLCACRNASGGDDDYYPESRTIDTTKTDDESKAKPYNPSDPSEEPELLALDPSEISIPAGAIGAAIDEIDIAAKVNVSNASGTLTYTASGNPDWIKVGADGKITGTRPDSLKAGIADFTVTITDGSNPQKRGTLTVKVGDVTVAEGIVRLDNGEWANVEKWTAETKPSSAFVMGVVAFVDEESNTAYCVNVKIGSDLAWVKKENQSEARGYDVVFKTSNADGSGNWDVVKNEVADWNTKGNYPAFEYAEGCGNGWYLPAIDELKKIGANKDKISAALKKLHDLDGNAYPKDSLDVEGGYWSSSQQADTVRAAQMYFVAFNFSMGWDKGVPASVLVLRKFKI